MTTRDVLVPTTDGPAQALLAEPDGAGPHPAVVLYMDAFGLRPQLRAMAGRLAEHGYVALVPNVFHRSGPADQEAAPDLRRPEDRERVFAILGPFMAALTPELAVRDSAAWLNFLAAQPSVRPGPVATTGYCMGGALSLRTAAAHPDRVAAAASFHGGRLATDAPDSPHLLADRLHAEVYVAHADQDPSMPPDQIALLERSFADAGVRHTSELYDGAAHGFTMADTAAYDEAAAERHWAALLDLLGRALPRQG